MRERRSAQDARRAREFEAFVAGAAGRLLHAATLLTAESPDDNPRARRLLTLALSHTYASWDRLRGEDPYDRARQDLAGRFARSAWHQYGGPGALGRSSRPHPGSPLARLTPQERLILVLRLYEGVAEEQAAALLGIPVERVRAIYARAMTTLLHPPRGPAPALAGTKVAPS
ncbi:sigma factor-like helix-turn-helix DNA-binding protein [Streptomyces dysideae]|uniref:RNA polymerase subunit sigma-70 n=1 Tax=Streptomyces dysideae TaxID=909626 RepID=A0A117S1U2_9ACTN|nr:sigma factor-like helix-turn-helix DNA-binding protein [Streptomyces dysideae]KUO21932.1 RNA polymerase subunit sigma-70 [Streptomyces dysideae]